MGSGLAKRAALLVVVFAGTCASAHAAGNTNLPCGSTGAQLQSAVATANLDTAADTITLTGGPCTFTLTTATPSGGTTAMTVTRPLTIVGNGNTIARDAAAPNFRIFFANGAQASLTLNGVTIRGGRLLSPNNGAGILTSGAPAALEGSKLVDNVTTGVGGGVATQAGSLRIDRTEFSGNSGANGGAIATIQTGSSVAPATIKRSLFLMNGGAGGGVATVFGGVVDFENSTFAVNTTTNGTSGVVATVNGTASSTVRVISSTFADSTQAGGTAPANALAVISSVNAAAKLTVTDTIVTDTDSSEPQTDPPCGTSGTQSTFENAGGNLQWPGTGCGFGQPADPMLQGGAGFGNFGGATATYRVPAGSAAIDRGGADCPATDQRDVARPDGDACDTGAVETPAPETEAEGPDGTTNDPSIAFSSPDTPAATFECQVDDGDFTACSSPFEPVLDDGEHTVRVRAIDAGGYKDPSPASVTFTVDATPPVVAITQPASPQPGPTAQIEFTVDEAGATTTCRLDGGAEQPCSSPWETPALTEGEHTVTVTATDAAGNSGSDSASFGVSFAPPETTITSGPSGTIYNQPSVTFTFTSSKPGSTFQCRLDAGAWAPCSSPKTVSGYTEGTHTFQVRATDAGGRVDPTPASRTFTYKRCTLLKSTVNLLGQPVVICL